MLDLLQSPWVPIVGLALVHFWWQGALVHAALAVGLWVVPARRADVRYALACVALVAMFTAPMVTVLRMAPSAAAVVLEDAAGGAGLVIADRGVLRASVTSGADVTAAVEAPGASGVGSVGRVVPVGSLAPLMPLGVVAWLLGVTLLLVRLAGGLALIHGWRTRGVSRVSADVGRLAAAVARRMGLRHPVQVLESARVAVPMVVGVLRPVVLLPVSAVSGLSPRQLEMLLAHEFAHVRRLDPLVNLFQHVVEAVLFYHPSIWMVSGVIRREREFYCDEAATAAGGDRLLYASTLRDLAVLQHDRVTLGVAASGGSLRERIRRLVLGPATSSSSHGLVFAFSALSVALLIGLASALGSDDVATTVLADPEAVHALDVEQMVRLLEEAPSLPVPQRLALVEALAPVAAGPADAAAAFRRVVETLPSEALEGAHPAIRWPPYPGEGDGTWVWVTAVGSVHFEDGFHDVVAVDPEGWLRIDVRHADGARSLVAEPGRGDEPVYGADGRVESWVTFPVVSIDYFVDGVRADWDDAARDWLGRTLTLDPEWEERLRALEWERLGSSGSTFTTGDEATANLTYIAPDMIESYGENYLLQSLFALGVPNPDFPDRPPRQPFPDLEKAALGGIFGAYHSTAHGLVTARELEVFLEALGVQLAAVEAEPTGD